MAPNDSHVGGLPVARRPAAAAVASPGKCGTAERLSVVADSSDVQRDMPRVWPGVKITHGGRRGRRYRHHNWGNVKEYPIPTQ